jgi:hypothetical protein
MLFFLLILSYRDEYYVWLINNLGTRDLSPITQNKRISLFAFRKMSAIVLDISEPVSTVDFDSMRGFSRCSSKICFYQISTFVHILHGKQHLLLPPISVALRFKDVTQHNLAVYFKMSMGTTQNE